MDSAAVYFCLLGRSGVTLHEYSNYNTINLWVDATGDHARC